MTIDQGPMTKGFTGALALAMLLGLFTASVIADDRPTVAEEDDALLERLIEESLDQAASIRGTIDRMRRAGKRIGDDADTGAETRRLQQRAVDDLNLLLELAKRQQRKQPSSSQPPPRERPDQRPMDPEPMPGDMEELMPMPGDPRQGDPGSKPSDADPAESTDRRDEGDDRETELAERRRLVKDVWGHLSPSEREELLNARSDEPLPRYEELVNAYFRALAERSRRGK